ncbi:hypothetical protein L7F22_051234 [Adiantum nelumboides]|nr:hypothetical protein [Adiantum nelumboides]
MRFCTNTSEPSVSQISLGLAFCALWLHSGKASSVFNGSIMKSSRIQYMRIKVTFAVKKKLQLGYAVSIFGYHSLLGKGLPDHAIQMSCADGSQSNFVAFVYPSDVALSGFLRDRFTLRRLTERKNPGTGRRSCFSHDFSLLMSAFSLLVPPVKVTFAVKKKLQLGYAVSIFGYHSLLGKGLPDHAIQMSCADGYTWSKVFKFAEGENIQYSFVIVKKQKASKWVMVDGPLGEFTVHVGASAMTVETNLEGEHGDGENEPSSSSD